MAFYLAPTGGNVALSEDQYLPEQQAAEAEHQIVDAVINGSGVVYVSGDELATCPCPLTRRSNTSSCQRGAGWLTKSADREQGNTPSSTAGDWQRTIERIEQLKTMTNGVLAVQRDKHSDSGRIADLQIEFSIQGTPPITIIPVQDRDAFISILAMRSKTVHAASSRGQPAAVAPYVTDKRMRRLLTCLPGLDDPTAHKLLVRFKTVAKVLTAEEDHIQSAAGLKAGQAARLHRLLQCCRGHSNYSCKPSAPAG